MRTRIAAAIALLLLPAAVSAQRMPVPRIGRRGPDRPQPLPPPIAPVAQELAYRRSHLSVESYPVVSFVDAPAMTGGVIASWTSVGMGARADYRFNRFMSATFDATQSLWGGPARMETAELGTRIHRERTESKWYPFLDLRVGYIAAYASNRGTIDAIDPVTPAPGVQYSRGLGAIGGVGTEYALSRMFSLTTAISLMRGRMTTHNSEIGPFTEQTFPVTSLRYTVALRFNPVRVIRASSAGSARSLH